MRKVMFLLISSALIFSLVGCGTDTSATSDSSSATTEEVVAENLTDTAEVVEPAATEENEKLNTESSNDENKIQGCEDVVTPGLEAKTSVNWEDYFDGSTWNLTAYAEALGYEWIPDPESQRIVMYKMVHDDGNYFCCYYCGSVFTFFGSNNGECWFTSGISTSTDSEGNISIISNGQEDMRISEIATIEEVATFFAYVATVNEISDLAFIPNESYTLAHVEGIAHYYDNGLIKQREFGSVIESQICHN